MGNAIALWEKSLQKYMMAEDNSLAAEKQQMSVKENLIEAVVCFVAFQHPIPSVFPVKNRRSE